MFQPGTRRYQKQGKSWQEIKKESCGKIEEIGDFSSINMYKTEMMLEEEKEEVQIICRQWMLV
jgi:hypothetical protein